MRRLRSLELNWIRNCDKSLLMPDVIFTKDQRYGGYYLHPYPGEAYIDGHFYTMETGIIVIAEAWPENIASTIAHEWRHHWQMMHGWKFDHIGWDSTLPNYEEQLRAYVRKSRSEADAVRFQFKVAPCGVDEHWRSVLSNAVEGF